MTAQNQKEARSRLDALLDSFEVDDKTRALVWKRVVAASYNPGDPMAIVTAIETMFEAKGAEMASAINALPDRVREAAQHAIGPVAEAASANVEQRIAAAEIEAKANFKKVVENALRAINDRSEKSERAFERVAMNVEMDAQRKETVRTAAHLIGMVLVIALLAIGAIGFGVGQWSYNMGRAETAQLSNELAALASRPDAGYILQFAEHNNFQQATTAYCGTGGSLGVLVEGVLRCGPFWWNAPPVAGESSVSAVAAWNIVNGPFRSLPPLALIAIGIALAIGFKMIRDRFGRKY